ncbi:MAG: response regulator [Desulfobacteraceae bacterium]
MDPVQKILIVDDKRENLVALRQVLQGVGSEVVEALSGNEALAATLDHQFALAILDVMMPGMNGFELAEHLHSDEATRLMPVIFVTAALPDERDIFCGYEAGAVDYIFKPYAPEVLLAKVRIFLQIDRQKQELQWQRDHLESLVVERTKELEQELAERKRSEKKFKTIFEQAAMGVSEIDTRTGRFIHVNQRYADILGMTVAEMLETDFQTITHPDDIDEDLNHMDLLIKGELKEFSIEKRYIRKDGNHVWVNLTVSPLWQPGEEPTHHLAIAEDITQRKQAEEEHQKLQEQLNQAHKMEYVGRLAGGVAHDFNNMLGVILGHTELALDRMEPSSPIFSDLTEIRTAAERSADLTRQLLAFARKQTVSPRILDLNDTVEGMLKMLRRLIGETIQLIWVPGKDLWKVRMDPGQIDQILANLCVNARDAVDNVGQITIETTTEVLDGTECDDVLNFSPGEYVVLSVSDNGAGMTEDVMEHLFEPFFTTKEVGKGTGLGLATVYGIVKQNNGFIKVSSEPEKGTTFKLFLPRLPEKLERHQPLPSNASILPGHETILLVEDEPSILQMTVIMLKRLGYTVLSSTRPKEATRLAGEYSGNIHLLITDVIMPGINGEKLAKSLMARYPNLKCLFMSGYTADVIAHHGVLEEGVNFIQKPFSMVDLAAKVRRTLDG